MSVPETTGEVGNVTTDPTTVMVERGEAVVGVVAWEDNNSTNLFLRSASVGHGIKLYFSYS